MSSILGDVKQQFGDLGKQVGQSLGQTVKDVAKTTVKQVGFEVKECEKPKEGVSAIPQEAKAAAQKQQETEQFVKELYGATSETPQTAQPPKELQQGSDLKSQEELQKMAQLKQQLHAQYYQQLNNPIKRQEEVQKEQERASDRVERLKMEDLQENQKKEEKKKPIAVTQAANKTESRPGAG